MNKALIVAPHVDDEVIGCWSILNGDLEVTVLYLEELTDERKAEAHRCASHFGFTPVFYDDQHSSRAVRDAAEQRAYQVVCVPSRKDAHAAHKRANASWRMLATHYYSVDMQEGVLLPDAEEKRKVLDSLFPSQADLWKYCQKYWLFEDLKEADYDTYYTMTKTLRNGKVFSVKVLYKYAASLQRWYDCLVCKPGTATEQEQRMVVNDILSICVTGQVTITYGNLTIEA